MFDVDIIVEMIPFVFLKGVATSVCIEMLSLQTKVQLTICFRSSWSASSFSVMFLYRDVDSVVLPTEKERGWLAPFCSLGHLLDSHLHLLGF
jgi:hypothetical protein